MSYRNRDNNDPKKGKRALIWLGIFLLIFAPMVTIPLGIFAVIFIALSKAKNNGSQNNSASGGYTSQYGNQHNSNPRQYNAPNPGQFTTPQQYYQPTKRTRPVDDCPKPVCTHNDKGVHHVRRGKEIDPWDRPDIDISKYQRKG